MDKSLAEERMRRHAPQWEGSQESSSQSVKATANIAADHELRHRSDAAAPRKELEARAVRGFDWGRRG
jgi:hypothetical protein